MLTCVSALTVSLFMSQIASNEGEHPSLPPHAALLSAQLSSLSDERFDWRVRNGLFAIGAGAATLGVGVTVAHGAGAPPEILTVPVVLGAGLMGFGVLRLIVPTAEEELARRYESLVTLGSDEGGPALARFESEWRELIEHEKAGRDVLGIAYAATGVAGIAAFAYLAITNAPSPALHVSTAAGAVLGMAGSAYGLYLWKIYLSPVERAWRAYEQSRNAFVKAPNLRPATPPLAFGVDVQPSRSMFVLSGRF